jgi:hypothetical protein
MRRTSGPTQSIFLFLFVGADSDEGNRVSRFDANNLSSFEQNGQFYVEPMIDISQENGWGREWLCGLECTGDTSFVSRSLDELGVDRNLHLQTGELELRHLRADDPRLHLP